VLLDLEGRPLLGDLGLGHVLGEVSPGVWGTEGYVAPEVLLGADPGPASDVYALGALGWLCLTGSVPGAPGLRPRLADISLAGPGAEPLVRVLDTALAPDAETRPSAHELAWQLFHVARAQPLDLVRGSDEVSAVTYRLRAAAGRDGDEPDPVGRLARAATRLGRLVAARTAVSRTEGRHGRPYAGRRVRVWGVGVLGATAVVVALVAVLVLAVAVLGPGDSGFAQARSPADRVGGAGVVRDGSDLSGTTSRRTDPPTDPRADPSAPSTRPTALLEVLADARASAWREATPSMLHAADAPGSVAAARDSVAVAGLAREGLRFTGLRYLVLEAETVSATADAAVLKARIDTGPYVVSGAAGSTPRPAATGPPVLVDLVRTDVGWRVADLRPVP
jgi:eukaryotic-like serine/threonine-protein kinase